MRGSRLPSPLTRYLSARTCTTDLRPCGKCSNRACSESLASNCVRRPAMHSRADHVTHQVDELVHELLSPAVAAQVELHCQSCETCKTALEEARKRRSILES